MSWLKGIFVYSVFLWCIWHKCQRGYVCNHELSIVFRRRWTALLAINRFDCTNFIFFTHTHLCLKYMHMKYYVNKPYIICLPKGTHSEGHYEIHLICSQNCSRVRWGGSCRAGVGYAGVDDPTPP